MATEGANDVYDLVPTETLVLEDKASRYRWYKGLLVSGDMVMVADCIKGYVQLCRRHDGKYLARSHKLDSPCGIFCINEIEIGVVLVNNKIEVLSVQSVGDSCIITWVRTLTLHTGFVVCHAAVKFMDNVVLSGDKKDTMCWCVVSLNDGHVGAIYQICNGYGQSYLAIKDNMIYISCQAGFSSPVNGLWAYDIWNPSTRKFVYTHNDLKLPSGVAVDTRGFIFVCNEFPPCIHQLTDRCELLNIYKEGMPSRLDTIFWDQHYGHLYVISNESNVITRYRRVCCSQNDKTLDVMQRDERTEYITPATSTQMEQADKRDSVELTDQITSEESPEDLQRRPLPAGKKYHAFFSYSSSDIQWVKQTIDRLEKDHGFVCREYDRDNTPGTPLLNFAEDSIRHAYKTVIVMTREAFMSGFVLHEIQMAINLGFSKRRNCVVPVLLEDCEVPGYLSVLNYVDARDTKKRNIWWPKLLMELETKAPLVPLPVLAGSSVSDQTDVPTPAATACDSTPSTAFGLIQNPAYNSSPSTTTGSALSPIHMLTATSGATTTRVMQSLTSGSTTADLFQSPASGSTTADMLQAPTSVSTTTNVMPAITSASTLSTTDDLTPSTSASTLSITNGFIPSPTSTYTTADVMQISRSGSTTTDVMQAPSPGLTTADVMQAPTSGTAATYIMQTPAKPSTYAGPMPCPPSTTTSAMQAPTSSSPPSTTGGPMPDPTSNLTAAGLLQHQTASSTPSTTDDHMQAPTSSSTSADVTQPPAFDDTDRFMHIACLLVNVGSRVLRRLLLYHTVTPNCTLDQFLASNKIDIDGLRKKRILNKSQMDILFPLGGSTNLGEYDITLLNALFTNIVLTISQQQLNMIQFLRDKRNEIFAHAKSVTVDSSDYQTFWNDICTALVALSKQCGDPDFENEILREIQCIQLSRVQGTSFLDTLQTHPRRIETLERLVQTLISSQSQATKKESDDSDS